MENGPFEDVFPIFKNGDIPSSNVSLPECISTTLPETNIAPEKMVSQKESSPSTNHVPVLC